VRGCTAYLAIPNNAGSWRCTRLQVNTPPHPAMHDGEISSFFSIREMQALQLSLSSLEPPFNDCASKIKVETLRNQP